MKNIKKSRCLFVLAVFFSLLPTQSFAGPNENVLKKLYHTASAPAVVSDFPEREFDSIPPSGQPKCILVQPDSDEVLYFNIANTQLTLPGAGPLIPGETIKKLFFSQSSMDSFLNEQSFREILPPEVWQQDLTLTNSYYALVSDTTSGRQISIPAQILARKSAEYVAFKLVIDWSVVRSVNQTFYGYCYPSTQSLF